MEGIGGLWEAVVGVLVHFIGGSTVSMIFVKETPVQGEAATDMEGMMMEEGDGIGALDILGAQLEMEARSGELGLSSGIGKERRSTFSLRVYF